MRYLMHIAFDSSCRLNRNVYYLRYKKTKFKLIQCNPKWQNVLLTILPDSNNKAERVIYRAASEYLSAFSWQHGAMVTVNYVGGAGRRNITLRKAQCSMFHPREIQQSSVGHDIRTIPMVENEKQRKAIALFRQAFSNPNPYFQFLFYWHVVGIGKKKPSDWIDETHKKKEIGGLSDYLTRLHLVGNRPLGKYLHEDCRNAIAHINRSHGRRELRIDDLDDLERFWISTYVVKEFARFYIKNELGLNKKAYLVRRKGRGFPTYVGEDELREKLDYKLAYERKSSF